MYASVSPPHGTEPKQTYRTMTILAPKRDYIAIINNDEAHPIELRARDGSDARKQARRYMVDIAGWTKYDEKYTLKVRLATPEAPDAED